MKKKWFSIFAVTFLSFSLLTACAEEDSDTEDQTDDATEQEQTEEEAE